MIPAEFLLIISRLLHVSKFEYYNVNEVQEIIDQAYPDWDKDVSPDDFSNIILFNWIIKFILASILFLCLVKMTLKRSMKQFLKFKIKQEDLYHSMKLILLFKNKDIYILWSKIKNSIINHLEAFVDRYRFELYRASQIYHESLLLKDKIEDIERSPNLIKHFNDSQSQIQSSTGRKKELL